MNENDLRTIRLAKKDLERVLEKVYGLIGHGANEKAILRLKAELEDSLWPLRDAELSIESLMGERDSL